MYGFDGALIRTFPAAARVTHMDVTVDEERLLVACADGAIGAWRIDTGERLWWHAPFWSDLGYIYDASLSGDGKSLVACNDRDYAVILNAWTGAQIGKVGFPPHVQNGISSAALSPDGTKGACVDAFGRLFTFDSRSGQMSDSGITGSGPVRYSADGHYILCRHHYTGVLDAHFRVVAVHDLSTKDVGAFMGTGKVVPMRDGRFRAAAIAIEDEGAYTVGLVYDPASNELTEVWKVQQQGPGTRYGGYVPDKTDFDPERLIGVSTDWKFITRLIDLRTGRPLRTVDGYAVLGSTSTTPAAMNRLAVRPWLPWALVGALAAAAVASVQRWRKRLPRKTSDRAASRDSHATSPE